MLSLPVRIADSLLAPVADWPPIGIAAFAAAITVPFVWLAMRFFTRRDWSRRAMHIIIGRLVGCWLYRDRPARVLAQLGHAIRGAGLFFAATVPPLLVLIPPGAMLALAVESRLGTQPFAVGDAVVIRASFTDATMAANAKLAVVGEGLAIDAPPVIAQSSAEKFWRLRVKSPGVHEVEVAGERFAVVAESGHAIAIAKPVANSKAAGVREISANYRPAVIAFFGYRFHWAVFYVVFTLLQMLLLPAPSVRLNRRLGADQKSAQWSRSISNGDLAGVGRNTSNRPSA